MSWAAPKVSYLWVTTTERSRQVSENQNPERPKLANFRDRKKGSLGKGSFHWVKSLEPLKSLDSLESPENGWILLCFPQSGGSLKSLESLNSLESLENGLF